MGRALDGKRDYVGVKSILYVELITQNAESWIARWRRAEFNVMWYNQSGIVKTV